MRGVYSGTNSINGRVFNEQHRRMCYIHIYYSDIEQCCHHTCHILQTLLWQCNAFWVEDKCIMLLDTPGRTGK